MNRLPVRKTYKLFIGGAFPRSESGRTYDAEGANVARGSRKDIRDAVRVARQAGAGWSGTTAYNRGQVLYRVAEMMEARQAELASLSGGGSGWGREGHHRTASRARTGARVAHGCGRARRHRCGRRRGGARAARRREREANRPGEARRAEPVRDRRVPRAEDRLAPDRDVSSWRHSSIGSKWARSAHPSRSSSGFA